MKKKFSVNKLFEFLKKKNIYKKESVRLMFDDSDACDSRRQY